MSRVAWLRRRTFVRAAGAVAAAVTLPRVAHADDVTLKISLPRSETTVGRGVYCNVIVERAGGRLEDLEAPDFPELDGLKVVLRGSSSIEIDDRGRRKASVTYSYILTPSVAGTYALDVELDVEINGRKRTLSPATVPKLTATGKAAVAPTKKDPSARPDKADGEVFVWPIASKKKVYVGEQFVYTYELWERTMANVEHKTLPKLTDVYTRELEVPKSIRSEYLDGYRYRVHTILRRAAFAQKAGTLDLGGGTFTVRPSSGIGLFGPPRRSAPYNVEGPSIEIEVLPLPAKGQPADFQSSNVGTFTIESSLDRDAIKQGEGVTLTVTIKGKGNLALVGPGKWPEFEGFVSYDPKDESEEKIDGDVVGGSRTFEVLLVAEDSGRLEVPAVELSYFDPKKGAYETIKSSPHVVEVERDANAVISRADSNEVEEDSDATLAPPLESTLSRTPVRTPLMTPKRFWWGAALVPTLAAAWFGGAFAWRRLGPSDKERAGAALAKAQQQRLAKARKSKGTPAFFETTGEFLHHLALDWAGPEAKGLPRDRLMRVLADSVPEGTRDELASLLDQCDAARFGGGGADQGDVLRRVEALAQWRPG